MHKCPLCGAPMNASTQPALVPGRPDKVLLHCTNNACDWCGTEADMHDALACRDGYARAWAGGVEAHALLAETAGVG